MNLPQAFNEKQTAETAETPKLRNRGLLLPAIWGLAAIAMVGGAFQILDMTERTGAPAPEPVRHATGGSHPVNSGAEATSVQRLSDEIARLKADRDKLVARLEILERQVGTRNMSSVALPHVGDPVITGSIDHDAPAEASAGPAPDAGFDTRDGPVRRITFGIDLGSAPSVDRLKDRWVAMNGLYGATLAKLEPKVVFGRTRDGAIELRLIAGPFQNAESAVKACAMLQTERATCEPRPFEGESLPKS